MLRWVDRIRVDVYLRRSPIDISLHGEDRAYPKTIHPRYTSLSSEDSNRPKFFSTKVAESHRNSQEVRLVTGESSQVGDSGVYRYGEEGKSFVS